MNRREAGSIAFGLSIGFVASVGISFTLKTGLLSAWLLFLPTDILGARRRTACWRSVWALSGAY